MNAIEVSHVSMAYKNFSMEDVSFSIPDGSIMGLIGENGAGKTTLIHCLLHLIPDYTGTIRLLGKDAADPISRIEVGFVPDQCPFHTMLTAQSIEKQLALAFPQWDSGYFHQLLARLSLPEKQTVRKLSKGMGMKLSLAAALAHHPRLLLLDEATAGLDPVVRDEVMELLRDFVVEENHAVLMSTHITSDIEKVADTVTYLHRGKVLFSKDMDELKTYYGRLVCTSEQLADIPAECIVGMRENRYNCEALVKDRRAFLESYPKLTVDPVSLEEIMVFVQRGESK